MSVVLPRTLRSFTPVGGPVRPPVPVIVLTGFLGAGKTTLVNHLLRGGHGLRLAVLVNEFGALGIDGRLILGGAMQVVELANGCICCATQGDLLGCLDALLAGDPALEGILVETSGLADPVTIVAALERARFARDVRIGCVAALVDAANFDANLDHAEAAFQQIIAADVILLNKIDLVDAVTPVLIESAIARLNPRAPMIRCVAAEIHPDLILGFSGDRKEAEAATTHRHEFEAVSVSVDMPLDPALFDSWLDALPSGVCRAKGFVRFDRHPGPFVFHLVGGRRTAEAAPDQAVDGAELVLIGRGIAGEDFRAGLLRCVAR